MKILVKVGWTMALCVYLLFLAKFILFKHLTVPDIIEHFTFGTEGPYWRNHNFIPLKTIAYYLFWNEINFNTRINNLAGNIVGFVPFGLLLPLLSNTFHHVKKVGLATFGLSLTFELLQLVFRFGRFDVDDLLLNTVGGLIGYAIFTLAGMYPKQKRRKQKRETIR